MEHAATGFLPCALLFPLRVLRSCCACYPSRCAHYASPRCVSVLTPFVLFSADTVPAADRVLPNAAFVARAAVPVTSCLRAVVSHAVPGWVAETAPTASASTVSVCPTRATYAGFAFSSDFKNRIWPNQNSTICAQGPDWAWLKDVTPAYLFEVAFYKFWGQRATAIARIPDGAVKPCWHDESITGNWCSLANLLNPSVPTQEGQAACGHCKVEEYELLFSCWASYGWGHVGTHTPPGATAKTVHHFYFNKDPPSFIDATDAGAMAFKNECPSVRSAGASLLRGSAEKGASAARALATGAKVKTTAVKDEEQPQQQ